MYWLITFKQKNVTCNEAIAQHPADWLAECIVRYPHEWPILLMAIEITKEQYDLLSGAI